MGLQQIPLYLSLENEILDIEEKPKRIKTTSILFGGAIILFVYWFVAGIVHWPFAGWALLLGLLFLFVVMVLRFLKYRKTGVYQYFYFSGKVSLLAGIYCYIMHIPYAHWFIWGAFGFFGLGLLALNFRKS